VSLLNVQSTVNLLARILIAKIENEERLVEILRSVPVVQDDPNWRCRTWLANALAAIKTDGKAVGTAQLDWYGKTRVLLLFYPFMGCYMLPRQPLCSRSASATLDAPC
jgi:hypothetical protein